uniref:Uncharacterized protein n=1 Tax=Steinernema glaseri TaxID=37863 RepID=A0A1I7ZJS2_9BILA
MRSTIRLLALLLFLSCCFLTTASYENVIACVQHSEVSAFKWSAQESVFVETDHRGYDCDLDSIFWTCRSAYKNVSYVVELKEAQKNLTGVPLYFDDDGEKLTMEIKLFKCVQEGIRAPEPEVPEGSWSDRLSTVNEGRCISEVEWLNASTKECGKKPTNYVFGAHCGKGKYLDVTFVCGKPKIDVYTDFLKAKKDYHRKLEFDLFGRLAEIVADFQEAKKVDPDEALTTYIAGLKEALGTAVFQHSLIQNYTTHPVYDGFLDEKFYRSRETTFRAAKKYVIALGDRRSLMLFRLATKLLTNDTNTDRRTLVQEALVRYDIENVKIVKNFQKDFLEFKERLTEYYVEYLKENTFGIAAKHLGFLNESGASGRLASMYMEIFRPGFIDQKYMDNSTHSTRKIRATEKESTSQQVPEPVQPLSPPTSRPTQPLPTANNKSSDAIERPAYQELSGHEAVKDAAKCVSMALTVLCVLVSYVA